MNSFVIVSVNSVLMIIIVVIGWILHKAGRPYDFTLMAVHKLVGVAFAAFNGYLYYAHFTGPGAAVSMAAAIMIVVALLVLFVSGALLSEGIYGISMSWLHRLFTVLLVMGLVMLL